MFDDKAAPTEMQSETRLDGKPSLEPFGEYLGGEICAEALRLAGVRRLFGIPGVQNLGLYSALSRSNDADGLAVHLIGNEEASAFLAWGVWQREASLSCLCLIGGPGVTHALSGIACAYFDRTPMIVLTSGVRRGTERFQIHDVDNLAILRPVCKALLRPCNVAQIGPAVARAICIAYEGCPGPVALEIACDLYLQSGIFEWPSIVNPAAPPRCTPSQEILLHPPSMSCSDPLVATLRNLILRVAETRTQCTVVADPGRCAAAAVEAFKSDPLGQLLCPGRMDAGSCMLQQTGCAVPAAIGTALAEAGRCSSSGDKRFVLAIVEIGGFMVQGLELSFAVGLPLIVLVVRPGFEMVSGAQQLDVSSIAQGLGLEHCCIDSADNSSEELDAVLQSAIMGHAAILETCLEALLQESTHMSAEVLQPDAGVDALLAGLNDANVRLVFTTPQTIALNSLVSCLERSSDRFGYGIEVVCLTDAQSAGFAADAAARCFLGDGLTAAACLVDAHDPFGLTVLSGVGEAFQDRVPILLLVLAGDSVPEERRQADLLAMGECGPLSELCKTQFILPEALSSWAGLVAEAAMAASALPPGPVSLLMPRSFFQSCFISDSDLPLSRRETGELPALPTVLKAPANIIQTLTPDMGARNAVSVLLEARRPWIHAGLGAAKGQGLVRQLAEMLEAPVSTTFSGKGVMPEDHPLWLWASAGPALPPAIRAVAETCDVVLILGAQLSEIASCQGQWPPKGLKVVQVDADPSVLGANFTPEVAILGDVVHVLEEIVSLVEADGLGIPRRTGNGDLYDERLRPELRSAHENLWAQMRAEAALPSAGRCSPLGIYRALQSALPPDASVYVADSGNTTMMSAEMLRLGLPRHFLAPTDFSSMGYGVPAAIGAALAAQAKKLPTVVAATVGDGAFLMTGLELLTAKKRGLPLICVIMRDGELGMISGLQRARGDEEYCTLVPHGLDTLCVGKFLGIKCQRVTSDAEAATAACWAYGLVARGEGPVIIEAMVSYCAPSFYARGAAAHDSPSCVEPAPIEILPLARLPTPKGPQDEPRAWARDELMRRQESGEWDLYWCLQRAKAEVGTRSGTLQQVSETINESQTWTYDELERFAQGLAAVLQNSGVKPCDRVGVLMPNVFEHALAHYAIVGPRLRCIVVNLNVRLHAFELVTLLRDSSPAALIAHGDAATTLMNCWRRDRALKSIPVFWTSLSAELKLPFDARSFNLWKSLSAELACCSEDQAQPELDLKGAELASSPCQMYYTSGSTGQPKALQLSHEIVLCHALSCVSEHRFSEQDRWLHAAPMYHLVDAFAMFSLTAIGGAHVFLPGQFNPERLLKAFQSHEITCTNLATSMVALILAAPCTASLDGCFPHLRLVSCGGAPLSQESILRAQRLFGCEFFQSYGMTECCGKISMSILGAAQRKQPLAEQTRMLCSSGRAFEAIKIRVVDVNSRNPVEMDGHSVGEVEVCGRTVFKGYLPPRSKVGDDTIRDEHFTTDGWFRTGDLATTRGGYLQVVGRLKDMILVGSENVYCAEVENALCSHPAIALCCVYGVRGPEVIGEMVKAVLQLRDGATRPSVEEVQSFCGTQIADFKVPRLVIFRDALPLMASGKVDKMALKRLDSAEVSPVAQDHCGADEPAIDITIQGDANCQDLSDTAGSPHGLRTAGVDRTLTEAAAVTPEDLMRNFRYSVSWHEAPISRVWKPEDSTGCWMIVSSDRTVDHDAASPVISELLVQLEGRGVAVVSVKYQFGNPLMLPEGRRCSGIICMMPRESSAPRMHDGIGEKMCRCTYDGLSMIHAIAASEVAGTSEVVVAAALDSRGSLMRQRPLAADASITACWSFARTASNEMDIPWRLVEICSFANAEQAAATLIDEASSALSDVMHGVPRGGVLPAVPWHSTSTVGSDDVAWSRGIRWIPRLQQMQTLPDVLPYDFLQNDGGLQTCIVTGGTGSLGQQLVKFLADSEQLQHIVAVGRRPASQVAVPDGLSNNCNVQAWSADISKLSDCSSLIEYVKTQLPPCTHVFHLAGFLPHNGQVPPVRKLQWADCVPVLRPKIDGSVNLITAGDSDLPAGWKLVCFSSIYATLGYPRLAPYAAANGFQDGLAECRMVTGHNTLSISWSPFAAAGMGHRTGSGFRAFWHSQGMAFVPLLDGMQALGCILGMSQCPPHIGVYPMSRSGRWPAPLFRHPFARRLTEEIAWDTDALSTNSDAKDVIKVDDIQNLVLNTISGLLGCSADEVPFDEAFSDFGLTSMMSVDMSIRLGQALNCQLPATLAFDLVNVEHLCEYLKVRLCPKRDVHTVDSTVALGNGRPHADPVGGLHRLAVDGLACVLPGGELGSIYNWADVWQTLLQGLDCVSAPPDGRPTAAARKESLTSFSSGFSQAGYLDADALMMFDAASFGTNTAEAEIMDPQQRLCLRVSREALEDGNATMCAAAAIGVFVGVTTVDFVSFVKATSTKMAPSAYTGTSLTTAICANRISYAFDLRGPSASCDSACSSSIVTTDLAFNALQSGRCKRALSLGVNVQMDPFWTEAFASAGMLSPSGRCRFGDDGADGYVRGEGCAALLLSIQKTEDAVHADPYATMKSVALNQDGRSNGLTAPNPAAQLSLLQQAWQDAALAESSANYIEAHGTGTFLGDPIEITAMSRALRASKSHEVAMLRTASFKSNIGHLECGAGAASTMKLALILQQAVVPMSLYFHNPNRNIDWNASSVSIVSEIEQLMLPGSASRGLPCGGVSGFGFGGTNGHIVMQAQERDYEPVSKKGKESLRAIVFSDCSRAAVRESARCLHAWLSKVTCRKAARSNVFDKTKVQTTVIPTDVCGIASAAAQRMAGMAVAGRARTAVVASSLPELKDMLSQMVQDFNGEETTPASSVQPRVAFVLIGTVYQRASATFRNLQLMGSKMSYLGGLCRALQKLRYELQDPCLATFAALYAAAATLRDDLGLRPSVIIGHGLAGEVAAFSLAGVFSCADASMLASGTNDSAKQHIWPPSVGLVSSYTGEALNTPPGCKHWQALAAGKAHGVDSAKLANATLTASCDILVEICLDEPVLSMSLQDEAVQKKLAAEAPRVLVARLGPPADGRVTGADSLAKSLLTVATSMFGLGGEVDLSKFTHSSRCARLPPRGQLPVLCWPAVLSADPAIEDTLVPEETSHLPVDATKLSQPAQATSQERTSCLPMHSTQDVSSDGKADLHAEIRLLHAQIAELKGKLASKEKHIQMLEESKVCSHCKQSSNTTVESLDGSPMSTETEHDVGSSKVVFDDIQATQCVGEFKFQHVVARAVQAVIPDISINHLGIDTDLIEMGLDSLSAIELSHRLTSALPKGSVLTGPQLLKEPTMRAMAKLLDDLTIEGQLSASQTVHAEESRVFPASALQRGILFHQISSERPDVFLETICLEVNGPLDVKAFRWAWAQVVSSVPQLLASFDAFSSSTPTQSVMACDGCGDADNIVSVHEMWDKGIDEVNDFITRDRACGMRIDEAPLLRVKVLLLQANLSCVVVTIHHLIIDGWSWRLLVEILQREYFRKIVGNSASVNEAEKMIKPFSSIVHFESNTDSTLANRYWSEMLQGVVGAQSLAHIDGEVDVLRSSLNFGVTEGAMVRTFASQCGITTAALLHAAWYLVYSSSSFHGNDDVLFGYTASRRNIPVSGIERIVGPVVNTLPLRIIASANTELVKFVRDVHRLLLCNADHEWLPLACIQEHVGNRRLFDVILDVQQDDGYSCRLGPETTMEHKDLIDCVGTPLSIRFVLRHDGSISCSAVSESSQFGGELLHAILRGIQVALSDMARPHADAKTIGSLRDSIASEMGPVKALFIEHCDLSPPELPLFAVAGPFHLLRIEGSMPNSQLSRDGLLGAFAAALNQWSNGDQCFLIWDSCCSGQSHQWVRAAVDRGAPATSPMVSATKANVVSSNGMPVVAFSQGCGLSSHQVGRSVKQMFCFNAAGSSAAQFAALSQELRGPGIEVVAVELPGHGSRQCEETLTTLEAIVSLVVSEHGEAMIASHASEGYALLGVSFGALVAFEVARKMTKEGSPPTQLLAVSQAAPTCAASDVDLDMQDADLVDALCVRGWLNTEFARSGPDVWQRILPAMRVDLAAERSYLLKRQHKTSEKSLLSCKLTILAGSEDTSLLKDADYTMRPWHEVTTGAVVQCIVPDVRHGFVDMAAGRTAVEQALVANRPGYSSIAVHLCVDGDQWALVGDDGLVPAIVVHGIADAFGKMVTELHSGGLQAVREVLPCTWCAEPMSTTTPLPTQLLQDPFLDREGETSQAAVIDVGVSGAEHMLKYANVAKMSSYVAVQLVSAGVKCHDRVALVSSKGQAQLLGAIGILQSGAAYLPIDPRQVPPDRAQMLLKLATVRAVVTDKRAFSEFDWVGAVELPIVMSEGLGNQPVETQILLSQVRSQCRSEASAYILYTSGSTGVPKGVNCHHQGAVNTCLDLIERFEISASDRVLALSSFSFDLSVYDLFGTAIAGGTVIVPQPETISPPDPAAWLAAIKSENVTLINAVPAFLELLVGYCETTGSKLPESLRLVWMSGDWVPLSLPQRIRGLAEGAVTVVVLGGATEAAIWSNMYIVPEQPLSGWKSIPYGRPLGNQSMYVLDEKSELLEHTAPWVTGMIYIGGAGVAHGYLGDDVKTAASFIIHPVTGERIYRTGDLGRLRPGEAEKLLIEILGREDSQVKLNGFRIELGEVEAEVSSFVGVEESCASVIHAGSGPFLAAFFRGLTVDVGELKQHLGQHLPSQLVPKALLRLDGRLPLNSNGKVDRKKLAEMHADTLATLASVSTSIVPPVGDVELHLVEAVAEVLSIQPQDVCVETNLFSVGLNSLGSMRFVAAALRRGLQLCVRDIFGHPTIRTMAGSVRRSDCSLQPGPVIKVFEITNATDESCAPFPLIGITKAYWTGLWSNPYCPAGCRPQIAFEFEWEEAGSIDVGRLESCFDEFIRRNAIFRAVVMRDSPCMRFLEAHEVTPIKFKVCRVHKEEDVQEECDKAYREIFDNVIDPCTFPLLQGCVVHLPNGRGSRFYYCVSLFVMDGITDLTWRLHISKLYRGETLPAPPSLTYKAYNEGYVNETTGIKTAAKWQAARDFWVRKIDAGLPPPPQLPILNESSANRGTFSDRGTMTISADHLKNIKAAAARFGLTPTALLLTLYCVSIGRHAASSKMLINVLHCLRHPVHDDNERVLGNFSSSFLCPVDVSVTSCTGRRSLLVLARAVMVALAECQTNNTISGVDVMSLINSKQAALGKAAAPYVFVSALGLEDTLPDWQSLCFRETRVVESTSGTYMVHGIKEYPDGSMLSGFNVVDGAFEPEAITALVNDHSRLLEAITIHENGDDIWHRCPDEILGELPVPAPLGSAPAASPTELLHTQLSHHAAHASSQIAIVDAGAGCQLSYKEYAHAATAVQYSLKMCSARDGFARCGAPLVAVVSEKSWQQVVAVLGVLAAECAYLPINVTAWPRSRIEAVLDAGEVVALVSSDTTLACLPWLSELHRPLVSVDQAVAECSTVCDVLNLNMPASADVIAYCIFTSGSTGKPKGVAMAHGAALNTLRSLVDLHQLDSATVVLGLSQLSFDLSVSDIFLTLRIGGTLVVPPDSSLSPPSPAQWRCMCAEHAVTLWNSVPALFGLLCEEASHAGHLLPSSLQKVWLSGDVIPDNLPALAQSVSAHQLQIFAMGGATEAGIWSNSADISKHRPTDGVVPYGNALPGQGMKVVRVEDLAIAAVGVSGMLVISGASLMMGYYNDEQTTSKALVEVNGEQIYLTQDAGYTRRRRDSSLECMITGRIHGDDGGYVKVRGFRVELQELEVVLRSHQAVKASVVALHRGDLAAYVVLHCESALPTEGTLEQELRNVMAASLPIYALPRWIQVLEALPLSSNGKVDRAALPVPQEASALEMTDNDGATSEVEATVLAAAQDLGIAVRSHTDNIFSVGADSVAGLRLIFKLESVFDAKIDVGRLFSDGRISSIAAAIADGTSSMHTQEQDAKLRVATLAGCSSPAAVGKRLPLFLCHGAGTTAFALSTLAAELVKDELFGEVFGISDSYLTSTNDRFSYGSIEEVAALMADLVVDALPSEEKVLTSEVALGGWSYGGVVAFACARILEARGLSVRLVLMLDAPVGQTEGCQLDEHTRAELVASVSSELAERIAKHFEACNTLLSRFAPTCGEAVRSRVLDIRPVESQVDFLAGRERAMLAESWHRVAIEGANHFTLVKPPFTEHVAKEVLKHRSIP